MDIKLEEEEEIKKEFQLERVILFTDAVFAIILTIMVLDIKLPEGIRHASKEHIDEAFQELILKFMAYAVSFFLVGRFWMAHLKLFRFLKDYDTTLLILNLLFLFSVTLFPFAVSLISGSIRPSQPEYGWGYTIYILVFMGSIFTQSLISRHLIKNKETLCINSSQLEVNLKWKIQKLNIIISPAIAIIVIVLNYFGFSYSILLIPIIFYGINVKRLTKKYYPENNKGPLIARLFKSIKK